tara:strand:+ start:2594 stop:3730 length:1137 start_codon:yes stop_codon:yes gene_type:complete
MKLNKNPIHKYEDIKKFCDDSIREPYITIDTEFIRNKSFFPKLCLIQLATNNQAIIIDTLSSINLEPIKNILINPKILKVFHSSRQDLEIIFNTFKTLPKNIFDTQIAFSFLSLDDQVSYEKLVLKYCNKSIDKKYQYYDWSLRPLNSNQIAYALSDVSYLTKIYQSIILELKKKKMLDWVFEETKKLLDKNLYIQNPKEYWRKIKINKKFKYSRKKLQLLTEYRENYCIKNNISRNSFLSDEKIITLLFKTRKQYKQINLKNLIDEKFKQSEQNKLLEILKQDDEPDISENIISSSFDANLFNTTKILLNIVSNKYNIAESMIAKVSDLKSLSKENKYSSKIFNSWRYKIFGNLIEKLFEGKLAITHKNGKIDFQEI